MTALALTGLALLLALPLWIAVAVLVLQVVAGVLLPAPAPAAQEPGASTAPRGPLAVLVPAHDEAAVIESTLNALRPQLRPGDRLLVVADNCSDDTAALARAAGAQVAERRHATQRGKGFALAHGLAALSGGGLPPPALVVIVDADCQVDPGALEHLAAAVLRTGRPAQALYLMQAGSGAGVGARMAEFAWRVRNGLRPGGGLRLGMPCQLMGTGMAFSWAMLQGASLANASIVEDMALGIELAQAGRAPLFCPEALVTSRFPETPGATRSQRTRWEHGHLEMILRTLPRLLARSLMQRDARLFGLALDLAVPPLALLAGALVLCCGLAASAWWLGGPLWPLCLAGDASASLAGAILLAWWAQGRDLVRFTELLSIPWYIACKVPIYLRFVRKRQKEWVRTGRDR